jgi:hypothetical protein
MATIMARMTRSGTFVGPGTNRKLRPGILGCDIISSLKAVQRREPSLDRGVRDYLLRAQRPR